MYCPLKPAGGSASKAATIDPTHQGFLDSRT
jgi:hypothetical protein